MHPISDVIIADGHIYAGEFERVIIQREDLSIYQKLLLKRLGRTIPSYRYLGPDLGELDRFLISKGLRTAKLLDATGIGRKYPLCSIQYLPEQDIKKYIALYTTSDNLFFFTLHNISHIWEGYEYFQGDENRQIALINCLLFWISKKGDSFRDVHPWNGLVHNPHFKPTIILKALHYFATGKLSFKGGFRVPRLNKPARKYLFHYLIDGSGWGGWPIHTETGVMIPTNPCQATFIRDANYWKRVFQYLEGKRITEDYPYYRTSSELSRLYEDFATYSTFMACREFNLAKWLYKTFDGFGYYGALYPEGTPRLRNSAIILGREVLHSFPTCLRDLENLGVNRAHAFNCLCLFISTAELHALEIIKAYEKHKFRAKVGRQILGTKFFEPAPSALTDSELERFKGWMQNQIDVDINDSTRKLSVLLTLGVYNLEDAQDTLRKYRL